MCDEHRRPLCRGELALHKPILPLLHGPAESSHSGGTVTALTRPTATCSQGGTPDSLRGVGENEGEGQAVDTGGAEDVGRRLRVIGVAAPDTPASGTATSTTTANTAPVSAVRALSTFRLSHNVPSRPRPSAGGPVRLHEQTSHSPASAAGREGDSDIVRWRR